MNVLVATVEVTVLVATVFVEVDGAAVTVTVATGTGNLLEQKECAAGIPATSEATSPTTPPQLAPTTSVTAVKRLVSKSRLEDTMLSI